MKSMVKPKYYLRYPTHAVLPADRGAPGGLYIKQFEPYISANAGIFISQQIQRPIIPRNQFAMHRRALIPRSSNLDFPCIPADQVVTSCSIIHPLLKFAANETRVQQSIMYFGICVYFSALSHSVQQILPSKETP